jgi:hypothetical protein
VASDKLIPEPEEEEAGRGMDPEVRAIGRILRLLNDIEEPARSRVIAYLYSRFYPKDMP